MKKYNSFISKHYKKRIMYFFIILVPLIFFEVFLVLNFSLFIIVCGSIFILRYVVILFLDLYKLNLFFKNLTNDEKNMLEIELETLFFDGNEYALTDHYIIDLKKYKLISYEEIKRINEITKLNFSTHFKYKKMVQVYTDNGMYLYTECIKKIGITLIEYECYDNLYNYIKYKNPNVMS